MTVAFKERKTVQVLAPPGRVVPLAGRTRKRFSDTEPRRVELTQYIRRRIKHGDLLMVETAPAAPAAGAGGKTPRAEKETGR